MYSWAPDKPQKQAMGKADRRGVDSEIAINCSPMDGPTDWWWKIDLLDVCVQAGFCQIQSHILIGSDYYWDLMIGEIQRGNTSPVAINTRL